MIKLFSGTAHPHLSKEVATHLKIPISKSEVVRFGNSEVRVRIEETVKSSSCIVIQPTANPTDTNLMELFLFCDALRREEAKRVIGIIPYFGYARQNIQHRDGECVSANVVIRILEALGFHKVYTFDMHDEATEGVFTIPFKNLSTFPLLAHHVKKYLGKDTTEKNIAIVSPDQGGIERARQFGIAFFGHNNFHLAVTEKKRDQDHIHQSEAIEIYGQLSGKTAIIVDDIATSAGTLIHSADLCIKHKAKRVIAAVAHHDFSTAAPERIQNSVIEKFFTTNTVLLKPEHVFPKLQEISVAELIAKELS